MPVMQGHNWSAAQLLQQPQCLCYNVTCAEVAAQLPTDFLALHQAHGLHSFFSIPIATEHDVVGVLTIAKEDSEGFEVDW